MIAIHERHKIDRPPEQVFDFIADMRNESGWNPDLTGVIKTTDGPMGMGTTFVGDSRRDGRVSIEIVRYERPWELGFRATGERASMAATIDSRAPACTSRLDSGDPAHGSGSPVSRKKIRSARAWHHMRRAADGSGGSRAKVGAGK